MNTKISRYTKFDRDLTAWMAKYGLKFLRISIGLIYVWFGGLKFFEGLSPAENLSVRTIDTLTFGILSEQAILYGLATWETLIGLGLLFNIFLRETLILLYLQILGTFTPLFLFPSEAFIRMPYVPTLEGQYIIKNLIVVSAGIVIGATARGIQLKINENKGSGE